MGRKVHHDGESEASHYTISLCDTCAKGSARTSPRIDRRRTLPSCRWCPRSSEATRRSLATVRGLATARKRTLNL